MMPTSFLFILLIIGSIFYTKNKKAYFSQALVMVNFLIFLIMVFSAIISEGELNTNGKFFIKTFNDLGFKANYLNNFEKPWTIITSIFIHANFIHVLMNMFLLVLLGLPFEERIGTKNFGIIYFSTGILANLINGLIALEFGESFSQNPAIIGIGASGALFGIMGGFVVLYPRDKVIMPLGPILILQPIPVFLAVIIFGGVETAYVFYQPNDNIGHLVHVCGFVAGVILAPLIVKERADKKAIDLDVLEDLAKDQKEILDRIRNEDTKEIRDAWIEHLLKIAKCPKCGKGLEVKGEKGVCECGFKIKLMKKV